MYIKGETAHEALLARQDAELRLLENMKRCLALRIKCDREYAISMNTVVLQVTKSQGGRGHWAVYYTSLQSFTRFSYLLGQQLRYFYWILIGLFIKLNVQSFEPIIVIYRRDNYINNHWGCTSMYQPLAYPFRSLKKSTNLLQCISFACLSVWLIECSNLFKHILL